MDAAAVMDIVNILKAFGPGGLILIMCGPYGLILFMWWKDGRRYSDLLRQYKKDVDAAIIRYDNNILLVEKYDKLAGDLKEIIMLNTEAVTRQNEALNQKRYCMKN